MTTTFYRLMNRSLYIFLVNWKNHVNEITSAIEAKDRRERTMKSAVRKMVNK